MIQHRFTPAGTVSSRGLFAKKLRLLTATNTRKPGPPSTQIVSSALSWKPRRWRLVRNCSNWAALGGCQAVVNNLLAAGGPIDLVPFDPVRPESPSSSGTRRANSRSLRNAGWVLLIVDPRVRKGYLSYPHARTSLTSLRGAS